MKSKKFRFFLDRVLIEKCANIIMSSSHHLEGGDESSPSKNRSGALPKNAQKRNTSALKARNTCQATAIFGCLTATRMLMSSLKRPFFFPTAGGGSSQISRCFSQGFQQDLRCFDFKSCKKLSLLEGGMCQHVSTSLV